MKQHQYVEELAGSYYFHRQIHHKEIHQLAFHMVRGIQKQSVVGKVVVEVYKLALVGMFVEEEVVVVGDMEDIVEAGMVAEAVEHMVDTVEVDTFEVVVEHMLDIVVVRIFVVVEEHMLGIVEVHTFVVVVEHMLDIVVARIFVVVVGRMLGIVVLGMLIHRSVMNMMMMIHLMGFRRMGKQHIQNSFRRSMDTFWPIHR